MTDSSFDERIKKSFDFLQDVTKQLITLATAILTFTLTFVANVAKEAAEDPRRLLTISWILLVASCGFGIIVLLSMTGMLGRADAKRDIYSPATRWFSFAQLSSFGIALAFAVAFGVTWWQPT